MRFSSWLKNGLDRGRFSFPKTALGSTLLAASLLSGALLFSSATPTSVSASGEEVAATVIPEHEEGLEGSGLKAVISSSAKTDISQSFTLSMVSSATSGYNNGARRNNVFVVIDDPDYDPDATVSGSDLPTYTAAVHWIDYSGKDDTIYIPRTVTYKGHFVLTIHSIDACASYTQDIVKGKAEAAGTEDDYGYGKTKAKKIFIPSTIQTVKAGAFDFLPTDIELQLEAASVPAGFAEGWTDQKSDKITFGNTAKKNDVEVNVSATTTFDQSPAYIIGYYEPGEYYAPLLVEYDLYKKTGELVEKGKVKTMSLMSSINPYDGIGGRIGSASVTLNVDIDLASDEYVDPHSLVFHNIYSPIKVVTESSITFIPDLDYPYRLHAKTAGETVNLIEIDTFFSTKAKRVSTFGRYIEVDLDITPTDDFYQKINPTMYETYKDDIAAGIYRPRVLLINLKIAEYRVSYKLNDGTVKTVSGAIGTPVEFVVLETGKVNTVGFTFSMDWIDELDPSAGAKFSYENLVDVCICGFQVKTDLWINASNNSMNKSDTVYRFAALSLLPAGKAGSEYVNLVAVVLIGGAIYLGTAIVVALGYYLYCKRRFRNDEFRRVNDKKYWIAAAKNLFGFALVFLAIMFIVARFGIMITTVVSFNPLDVFVIVFALAGAIYIGLAIKGLVVSIRNGMKRRNDARLHLDKDKAEDGTR